MSLVSNNINTDFSVKLSNEWLYPSTQKIFQDYFDENNGMFKDMISYLNSTIVGVTMLGFTSDNTKTQGYNRGRGRTFQNSLLNDRKVKKTLDLTFRLGFSMLNYHMVYANCLELNKNDVSTGGDDLFLPPVILDVMDSSGNILFRYTYREIQVVSLSELPLQKDGGGISSKEFRLSLKCNIIDYQPFFNSIKGKSMDKSNQYGVNDSDK